MFDKPKPKSKLDTEINRLMVALDAVRPESNEYGTIVERLQKLHKLRIEETPPRVSPDVLVTTAANLIGIVLIIRHEHLNVITTKALSFIRLR